jgi:uncharacterized membrane protein
VFVDLTGEEMDRTERWLAIGFIALILLLVAVIVAGPLLEGRTRSDEPAQSVGPMSGTETLTARVVEVIDEGVVESPLGGSQHYQKLDLYVVSGSLAGQHVMVEQGAMNVIGRERLFNPGDRVYVDRVVGPQGDRFYITDYVRTGSLFWIVAAFVALVMLVGRGKGLRSLAGTLFSLVVIVAFVIPQIRAGRDPVLVCVVGSIVLLTVSTYLVYGWKLKAHAALAGMALSLVLTALLAWLFVGWTRLSGFGSEESAYLVMELGPDVSLRGLVLGGIIIGSLGVLDDICVGQASAIFELINANRELGWRDLFSRSLNIGRDHIASLVNTLVLAYVGASMPLVMVFAIYQEPLLRRLSREPIAEEIVRTMVGSIGLVLAVPITSLIASLLARWAVQRDSTPSAPARPSANEGRPAPSVKASDDAHSR